MNSKHIIILLILQISLFGYSQNLSQEVRQDFCKNAKINYFYGTDTFKSWIVISAQRIGLRTPLEIEEALQNICNNTELQEEILKNIDKLGGSREFKEQQYIEIGMKPQNAKFLNDYMTLKYNSTNKENQINNAVKDTITQIKNPITETINKLTNSELTKLIYPNEVYVNDSTFIKKRGNDIYHFRFIDKILFNNNNNEEIVLILASYKIINGLENNQPILDLIVTDILDEEERSYITRGVVNPKCNTNDLIYNIKYIFNDVYLAIGNVNDLDKNGNIKQYCYSLTKKFYSSAYTTTLGKE